MDRTGFQTGCGRGVLKCLIYCLFAATILAAASCKPNQRIVESSEERSLKPLPSTSPTPENSFQQDLESMRNAQFIFIYVYRRKDGGALDGDDRKFASKTIPQEMNRRTVTDQDRAIMVGSNFRMPKPAMDAMAARFTFEDMSPQQGPPGEKSR